MRHLIHAIPVLTLSLSLASSAALAGGVDIPPGFKTDIPATLTSAKAARRPLLIVFETDWCPACNELRESVFESAPFADKSKAFDLLRVDADADAAMELVRKYKIAAFPTVIFANSDAAEMTRVVGSRPTGEFIKTMDIALRRKGLPFIRACEGRSPDDLYVCATSCAANDGIGGAEHAYEKLARRVKKGSPRWFDAQEFFIDHKKNDADKRVATETLLRDWPKSPAGLYFASKYVSLAEESSPTFKPDTALLDAVLANVAAIKADPNLSQFGMTTSDVAQLNAEILMTLERGDAAKAAWKETADSLRARKSEFPKDSPLRGLTLQLITALEFSGDGPGAIALAKQYRERFPKDPTFHRKAAGIFDRAGQPQEALSAARDAYANAYGINKISNGALLVKLYGKVKSRAESQKIYEQLTAEFKPSNIPHDPIDRALKRLKAEWDKIQ